MSEVCHLFPLMDPEVVGEFGHDFEHPRKENGDDKTDNQHFGDKGQGHLLHMGDCL